MTGEKRKPFTGNWPLFLKGEYPCAVEHLRIWQECVRGGQTRKRGGDARHQIRRAGVRVRQRGDELKTAGMGIDGHKRELYVRGKGAGRGWASIRTATAIFPLGTRTAIVWSEADEIMNELAISSGIAELIKAGASTHTLRAF